MARHWPRRGMTRLRAMVAAGKGDDGHESLRPVGLVDGHCCDNNAGGEEGRHGENHDGRGEEVAQHQTCDDGSQHPLMAIATNSADVNRGLWSQEETFVAEDVTKASRDEDEGADREGVSRRELAHLARLILDAE